MAEIGSSKDADVIGPQHQAWNPQESGDARLAAAVLDKDRKATADFVALHADAVYAYVRSRLYPQEDLVDDLVQEVFLAAWEGLPGFRGDSPLQSWLIGIARHKVESFYRSRLREPSPLDLVQADSASVSSFPELDSEIDAWRVEEKTMRVMGTLPEAYRLALLWRYWERRPAREVAALTGKTEKAIERLLARAREQFRRAWDNEEPHAGR